MDISGVLAFLPAQYLGYASVAIAACSALISVLPAPRNMKTGYAYVWQVLDFVALNFGAGKTAAAAIAKGEVAPVTPLPAPAPAAPPKA